MRTQPGRAWTLVVVALSAFMLMLDLSIIAVALPTIRATLDTSFSQLQWVVDAYALALAAFLVTSGSLADRRGRRLVFVAGFGLFTLASLACGLAGSADVLILGRGIQGIGAAMLFAAGPALLGHTFHGRERAMAFGVFGAATGLALAAGPLIGGALMEFAGWRWIFFVNVPVGILAIVITWMRVTESRDKRARTSDWAGMATFTVALSALVFAIVRGNAEGWSSTPIVSAFAVAGVLGIAFVVIERRRGEAAMFPLSLFRNVTFVGMSIVALVANGAGLPSVFIETSFMQNVLGSTAWEAGLRFLPLTLSLFIFGAIGGALTGRVPFRGLMGAACLALGGGLLLTLLVTGTSTWTALIPSMIVTGAGMGLFNPTRAALAIAVTEPARAGMASGVNETFQQVGAAIGVAAIGSLFEHRVADAFVSSEAGQQLGPAAGDAATAVSAGAFDSVAQAAGPMGDQALAAANDAFLSGFHVAMVVCALCAIAAAVVAFTMLRTRDLHASSLSLIPPEVDVEPQHEPEPVAA